MIVSTSEDVPHDKVPHEEDFRRWWDKHKAEVVRLAEQGKNLWFNRRIARAAWFAARGIGEE